MRLVNIHFVFILTLIATATNAAFAVPKLPSIQAISPTVAAAGSGSFKLTVSGSNFNPSDTVTWNGAKLATTLSGSMKANAVVSATAVAEAGTAAVAMWDSKTGRLSNSVTFTITKASVSISMTPTSTSITPGNSKQFSATVTGTTNTAVMWSATAGTVSSTGLYTAPNTVGTDTVKATSAADTTQAASATVTVSAAASVAVSITPSTASVVTGGTQQFTAAVSGTTNTAVSWSATGGTISSAGFYIAPTTAGTYTVTATSTADTSKSASAVVTVTAPIGGAAPCGQNIAIGPHTLCGSAFANTAGGTITVSYSPQAGNGIIARVAWCGSSACNTSAPVSTATIGDNINATESCFVASPHSPFTTNGTGGADGSTADIERHYVWYCPSIPAGVTSFTVTTSAGASAMLLDISEWKAGSLAASCSPISACFENVDALGQAGNSTGGTTATITTSSPTINANDLIFASTEVPCCTHTSSAGAGYTPITVAPAANPGYVSEAKAVTSTGVQSATSTWTGGNAAWFGVIVPIKAAGSPSGRNYTTNFLLTENPISEGGSWVNGLTNGLDWSNCRTTTNLAFGTQNFVGNYNDSICHLTGSWGPVQTVTATVINNCGSTCQTAAAEMELLLHFNIAAHSASGYEVTFSAVNNGYCGLARWNGALNNFTSITNNGAGGTVPLGHTLVTGDVVKATIDSTGLITAYINNNPIPGCSARDTTFLAGNPGMGFFHVSSGNGLDSQWGYSSFTASDSGSTTATPATPVSVAVTPNSTSVTTNGTVQFSATVTGTTNMAVTWSVTSGGGTISSTGLYTAPSSAGTATVVATSVAAPSASALAYVAINAPTTAVLSASPTSVSFGSVLVGGSASQLVTLTNTGNSSVTVSSASLTGSGFNVSGFSFPFTLSAGASQSANVSFAPTSSGTASGSVSFVSNATNSPATVALSGSGTAAVQHTATLSWQSGSSSPAGYNVYRSTISGGYYSRLNSTLNPTATYSDSTVASGQTYYYVVTAVSSTGMESGYSSQVSAVIPTP